jgi:hypothetical protein
VTAPAEGLRPVYTAARARLGLIALLFVLAALAWWFTVDRMRGMDTGRVRTSERLVGSSASGS